MQDKYCVDCYNIYSIQSQYKGNHKRGAAAGGRGTSFVVAANGRHLCILALNRVNVVAVTTILVLHVGVIGHHVPCHYDFMFPRRAYHARLRARGVRGALPPGRGVWGGLRPPQGSRGVWGAARPPMFVVAKKNIKLILSRVVVRTPLGKA